MTIDERLDKLTERHEALAQRVDIITKHLSIEALAEKTEEVVTDDDESDEGFRYFDREGLKEKYGPSRREGSDSVVVINGRIEFSTSASKIFDNCTKVLPEYNPDTRQLKFTGFPEAEKGCEQKFLDLASRKASKNRSVRLSFGHCLKQMGYDLTADRKKHPATLDKDQKTVIVAINKCMIVPR